MPATTLTLGRAVPVTAEYAHIHVGALGRAVPVTAEYAHIHVGTITSTKRQMPKVFTNAISEIGMIHDLTTMTAQKQGERSKQDCY